MRGSTASRIGIVLMIVVALTLVTVFTWSAGESSAEEIKKAVAVLHPTKGNEAKGVVTFIRDPKGIRVEANVQGLSPGQHGFHIHEYGDCTAPDAESAGGHFNPHGMPHAAPTAEKRHVGDLGNLEADSSGSASLVWVDPLISFEGENSIIGRAAMVHLKADDLTSQPTGDAGARVACGVVGIAKE